MSSLRDLSCRLPCALPSHQIREDTRFPLLFAPALPSTSLSPDPAAGSVASP